MERVANRVLSAVVSPVLLLLLLPPLATAFAVAQALAAAGDNCTRMCGNISIPYPFGVEPDWYSPGSDVTCSDDEPPVLLLQNISEIFNIDLANGTVETYVYRADIVGVGIDSGPYSLAAGRNKLLVIGCNVQVILMDLNEDIISTCAAFCSPITKTLYQVASSDCSGVGCCQAPITAGLDVYLLQLIRFNGSWSSNQATVCVVDADRLNSYPLATMQASALPVVLEWVISTSTCRSNSTSPECRSSNSFCQNSTAFRGGHRCHCSQGFDGNPYILVLTRKF